MNFTVRAAFKCINCSSHKIETADSSNGLLYCTCRQCGAKFIYQNDEVDIIDRYIEQRNLVFTAMEKARAEGKSSSTPLVERNIKDLVKSFANIKDIDPIFRWYEIDMLTENFTDLSKVSEAQKLYEDMRQGNSFYVSGEDISNNDKYESKYTKYLDEKRKSQLKQVNKKLKRNKGIMIAITIILVAALLAGACGFIVYKPNITLEDVGAKIAINNSSFGLFGKVGINASIKKAESGVTNFIKELDEKNYNYEIYDIKFLNKNGETVKIKKSVSVTMPIPSGMRKENVFVYIRNSKAELELVESKVNSSSGEIEFQVMDNTAYAIVERPFIVQFADGEENVYAEKTAYWGEKIEKPDVIPTKKGYDFAGWSIDGKEFDFDTVIKEDTVVTPMWEGKTYTAYLSVGSNASMVGSSPTTVKVTFGKSFNLGRASSKYGTFAGWKVSSSNEIITDADGKSLGVWNIADDATLYPVWQAANSLTGTFEDKSSYRISTAKLVNNHSDSVSFYEMFGTTLSGLKNMGYSKVDLKVEIDIREIDDGYQEIFIAKSTNTTNDSSFLYTNKYIEHGPGKKLTSMKTHTFSATLNLSSFNEDIYIYYSAHGSGSNDWWRDRIKLTLTLS